MGKTVQKLFILKLEPDLHPEPEKLSEHGARLFLHYYTNSYMFTSTALMEAPKLLSTSFISSCLAITTVLCS